MTVHELSASRLDVDCSSNGHATLDWLEIRDATASSWPGTEETSMSIKLALNPGLVRGYVLLAIDICRLALWVYVIVDLVTNYVQGLCLHNAKLRWSISIAKREMGLHPA